MAQTVTLASPLKVDREDLLITVTSPSDPAPLIWNPAVTGLVPISATIQSAYKANVSVTMQIFQSDQTLIRTITIPSAAYPLSLVVGGSGSTGTPLNFTWDGMKDDGTKAEAGIFMYQFVVTGPNGDMDTDKSQFLSLTTPPVSDAVLVSDDGTTATYNVSYILASSPDPSLAGSSGQIDVYDPSQKLWKSQSLALGDLQPGPHTVLVSIPTPNQEGDYKFLVCVKDNAANRDKGGRTRYALQHNNSYRYNFINLAIIGGYHVAWVTAHNLNARLVSHDESIAAPLQDAPKRFAYAAPKLSVRAAVNGMFFGGSPSQITGEAGSKGWRTAAPMIRRRWCFGISANDTEFQIKLMNKTGNMLYNHKSESVYKVNPVVKKFSYGFSGIGLLVTTDINPADGTTTSIVPPYVVDLKYNANWPTTDGAYPYLTALAWSKNGDFFMIVGPGSRSSLSWNNVGNFIVSTLPNDPSIRRFGIQIKEAVMLDGGRSSEIAWFDNFNHPALPDFVPSAPNQPLPAIVRLYTK